MVGFSDRESVGDYDGRTDELLWGFNADEPCKSASITKTMCAYVVLQLAEQQPSVLDEIVTFFRTRRQNFRLKATFLKICLTIKFAPRCP